MLHMIVATHSPQTCPGVVPELREKIQTSFQKIGEVSQKLGITVIGGWTNMSSHTLFQLVDAPNAHAVDEMGRELGLMEWNTSIIYPVITTEEAQTIVQQPSQ